MVVVFIIAAIVGSVIGAINVLHGATIWQGYVTAIVITALFIIVAISIHQNRRG